MKTKLPTLKQLRKRILKTNSFDIDLVKGYNIEYGWLLPNGYSIQFSDVEHDDVLEALFSSECYTHRTKKAYGLGMIRKAGFFCYQGNISDSKAFKIIEDSLLKDIEEFTHSLNAEIRLDLVNGKGYIKGYDFNYDDFKQNNFRLRKMLTKKYEVAI